MITLTELQMKEVVLIKNGKRLGFIQDLEIDETTGYITALILIEKQIKGGFFQRPTEKWIHWDQIVIIGTDLILVNEERIKMIPSPQMTKMDGKHEES